MRFFKVIALAVFSCLLMAGAAFGACTVNTTAVNFGNYDPLSAVDTTAVGSIRVTCAPSERVDVRIGASPNSGLFNPRQMKHATLPDLLNYNVFTPPPPTGRIWGDGSGGTFTVSQNNVVDTTWNVNGTIPALQNRSAGIYTDTLVVTVYRRVGGNWVFETSASLTITATVIASCSVTGTTAVAFGVYDPLNAVDNVAGAGNFTFNCGVNTAYQLHISGIRQMNDGLGNLINYEIYTDAGRVTVWPSSTPSTETGTTGVAPITRNVFGKIFAGQDVPIGAYLSTVTVTVTY